MNAAPKLDGRRQQALSAEMMRRAISVLSGDGRALRVGQVASAIVEVAARIGEEATRRLDRVPEKQADNFYTAMGLGRDPALPARVPLMFKLADPAPAGLVAPAGTRVMATTDEAPVIFETEAPIALVPGTIAALWAVDTAEDRIFMPPPGVLGGTLPRPAAMRRALRSGAAAGATQLQIDPVAGLAAGMVLALGTGAAAPQYRIVEIKDGVVTIAPPLAETMAEATPVVEVSAFAPYAGSRDQQSHTLYIGHATLLDVPSAVGIVVTGAPLPTETEWRWFGDAGNGADWQEFTTAVAEGTRVTLNKPAGKIAKTSVRGHETLWIRARLPGASGSTIEARNIRLAVAADDRCAMAPDKRCEGTRPHIAFEAIAATTPIVPNQPFYPFGREPRLFDSFYIGCAEAFSKVGAEVSLCFGLGGPELGPMAMVSNGLGFKLFGVGTDGIPYCATFATGAAPQLKPLPLPPGATGGATGGAPFESQALLAARLVNDKIELVIAGTGAVHHAAFGYDSTLTPAEVQWSKLEDAGAAPGDVTSRLYINGDATPAVYALAGERLRIWETAAVTVYGSPVADLIPIDNDDAVLILEKGGRAVLKRGAAPNVEISSALAASALPALERVGWVRYAQGALQNLYVAGFNPAPDPDQPDQPDLFRLRLVRIDSAGPSTIDSPDTRPLPLPISFEPPPGGAATGSWPPTMVLATATPTRIVVRGNELIVREDPGPIGTSRNRFRKIITITGFGKTIVQNTDQGLLYRDQGTAPVVSVAISALRQVAAADDVPRGAAYALFRHYAADSSYCLLGASDQDRLLVPAQTPAGPDPQDGDDALFFAATTTTGVLTRNTADLTLDSQATAEIDILLQIVDTYPRAKPSPREDAGIWHLKPLHGETTGKKFEIPLGFPAVQQDKRFEFKLLSQLGTTASVSLREVVVPTDAAPFAGLAPPFYAYELPSVAIAAALQDFGGVKTFALPHALVAGQMALIGGGAPAWATLGPALPANPALSWEYWNGRSWWAVESGLVDGTANLLVSGGVFFSVPSDIRETEVGGRKNHWIRARLVGGDYGQARVTVTTTPAAVPPGAPAGSATDQTIESDLSSIRSPYLTVLDIGYCAQTPVLPELVLTEDSLGVTDQTSANQAGLRIDVFVPVAELMNPAPVPATPANAPAETCEEPCPPKAPANDPSPCDAPGAYDSCENPCIAPDDIEAAATPGATAGAERALLIGFDAPPAGDPVAIYADAEPGMPAVRLTAEILRRGRFEEIAILDDASHGLSEPGRITLSMAAAPELDALFGVSAHWLRLRPRLAGASWSPRLRGLFLNAASALSVETRNIESLGTSSGVPYQRFRLTGAPMAASSLVLRVREAVADEAAARLDIVTGIAGMQGQWVRWTEVDDLAGCAPDERAYALDADAGTIDFGDGIEGAIPPTGAELLAAAYQHVTGAAANTVMPGAELQLLSPIAGVDKVLALGLAVGGSDVETAASARRRAAPKLRHGGRVLTLADVEDFTASRFPLVAQARAARAPGGVRLIVALRGADPQPAPAFLRELVKKLGEVAGFGLARPGGLSAVGPRLLPVSVTAVVAPDDPACFADIALAVRAKLVAFFDAAAGGLDGRGWPLGLLPQPADVAAALDESLIGNALLGEVVIVRAGDHAGEPLPASIPANFLVRLDPADIRIVREPGAAA